MANKLIHLRVSDKLYSDSREIVKENGFNSIQEFVREAMRKTAEEFQTKMAIRRLKKLQGSVKGIKRMTKEERNKAFEEYAKKNPSEVFGKYGLDKVPDV
ncbi:hypothetical protein KJ660_01510 [Candidatus Micrarchaeota archaeon]|nr:hypothetical protein [Candidatus Micrarchaeota archaeon]